MFLEDEKYLTQVCDTGEQWYGDSARPFPQLLQAQNHILDPTHILSVHQATILWVSRIDMHYSRMQSFKIISFHQGMQTKSVQQVKTKQRFKTTFKNILWLFPSSARFAIWYYFPLFFLIPVCSIAAFFIYGSNFFWKIFNMSCN